MNFFDNNNEDEEKFSDQPEEIDGHYAKDGTWVPGQAPPPEIKIQKAPAPQQAAAPAPVEEAEDDSQDVEEELDVSEVLSDARLRLEMGRLYEMVLKHDMFDGVDVDPRAVKAVQKQIRDYAQERMEIMLGMRQEKAPEPTAFPMDLFPFNSLEVEVLKGLAATVTKGASRDAEPLSPATVRPEPRTTLKPIGSKGPSKPAPKAPAKPLAPKPQIPVKRVKADIQKILDEEGITMEEYQAVMDSDGEFLDREKRSKMTEAQITERNKQISVRNKRVELPPEQRAPVPTIEQQTAMYSQRASMAEATVKGWQELIGMVKAMPPTIVNNTGEQ